MSKRKTESDTDEEPSRSETRDDSNQSPDSFRDTDSKKTVTSNTADTADSDSEAVGSGEQNEQSGSASGAAESSSDSDRQNTSAQTSNTGESEREPGKRGQPVAESGSSNAGAPSPKPRSGDQRANTNRRNGSSGSTGGDETATMANGGNGPPASRRRPIIALIALLVALVALGLGIWLVVTGWQRLQGVQSHVGTLEQHVGTLEQKVNAITANQNGRQKRIGALSAHLQQQNKKLEDIRDQMATLKKRNQQLANAINGTERSWRLRRIRSLLLAANRILELQEKPQAALTALKLADRRAATLNDPNLFNLRKQLAKETSKLRALPSPDRIGIALKLATASQYVYELPLANGLSKRFVKSGEGHATSGGSSSTTSKTESSAGVENGGENGWLAGLQSASEHALNSVGDALGNLVIIRRSDTPPPALLPPDRAAYLAQNLILDLKNAEAAILRSHPELYKKNLASALKLLKQYFDTGNPRVSGLIKELKKLQSVKGITELPDISGSLKIIDKLIAAQDTAITEPETKSAGHSGRSGAGGKDGMNTGNTVQNN